MTRKKVERLLREAIRGNKLEQASAVIVSRLLLDIRDLLSLQATGAIWPDGEEGGVK